MDKKISELQSLYQEIEDILLTSIGNPISVQNKIQKGFQKLEAGKKAFLKYILKKQEELNKESNGEITDELMLLNIYTKYPSYLDDAFLIKLNNNKLIKSYSQEYNVTNITNQLYKIYENKDNKQYNNEYDYKSGVIFPLTPMQKILRNFISSETPYRGLLLIHGTGVGKTCTSIQIAENLKKMIKNMKTHIFVIRFDEFKRQIFENNK